MKKTLLLAIVATFFLAQCESEKDPFLITSNSVGAITSKTMIKQLDSIFSNDSIVKLNPVENTLGTQGEVEIYEKGGDKLMLLSPDNENNPNSTITNIQIFDERYRTEQGLTMKSTFKDVKQKYTIKNVETTIRSVVVFLEETEVYLTIAKDQLPENVRYDLNAKIEASQIPDGATFKYFMIGWEVPAEE